jgi:cell division protein ZapE
VSAGGRVTAAYSRLLHERGLVPDEGQRAVVRHLAALADALESSPSPSPFRRAWARRFPGSFPLATPRGVYLWGKVGRGKTWLLDLFLAQLPPSQRERSHFHHFMRDVHRELAALGNVERPLDRVAATIAARTRVLCLDELFVADIGDAMILHGLFAGLLREGVVLLTSSNWPPDALYTGGLQRERFLPAIALLKERLDIVELAGGMDFRLRHFEQAETYVLDGAPGASGRLDELFDSLAEGAVNEGGAMAVEGRQIPLQRSASGMGWFAFDALCEGPRSALDYIEIAQELHTVFITGVPVMDALRDDAARRFVTLVDEFYDRGVKLVLGAAAPPTQLYVGERLVTSFERTASRLIEMRSREYLAREHRATT